MVFYAFQLTRMWCIPQFSKRGHKELGISEDIMTLQIMMSHLKMVT